MNLTDGGEGLCGYIPSKETRMKMSKARLGIPQVHNVSEEGRRKLSEVHSGKIIPDWHKEILSKPINRPEHPLLVAKFNNSSSYPISTVDSPPQLFFRGIILVHNSFK